MASSSAASSRAGTIATTAGQPAGNGSAAVSIRGRARQKPRRPSSSQSHATSARSAEDCSQIMVAT